MREPKIISKKTKQYKMIKSLIDKGYSSNKIQNELRVYGLGLRRKTLLSEIRSIKGKTITKEKIEFVKDSRVIMPHLPLKLQPLPFDILKALSKDSKQKFYSLQELISQMGGSKIPANSMSVGRNLTLLRNYGYISEKKVGKRKEIKITPLGEEMLALERTLHKTLPIGPEEAQVFYINIQKSLGLKTPPY